MVLTALGMLVVVAVVVVFLALPGSSRTSTATNSPATLWDAAHGRSGEPPPIHYRGTGAPPPSVPAFQQPPFRYTSVGRGFGGTRGVPGGRP
jgi:hypothetical protein